MKKITLILKSLLLVCLLGNCMLGGNYHISKQNKKFLDNPDSYSVDIIDEKISNEKESNQKDDNGYFIFRSFLVKRDTISTMLFLKRGIDIYEKDACKVSILYQVASKKDFVKEFEYILNKYKNVNLCLPPSPKDISPIEICIYGNNMEGFKKILKYQKYQIKHFRDKKNRNLLHFSIYHNRYNFANLLSLHFNDMLVHTDDYDISPIDMICVLDKILFVEFLYKNNLIYDNDVLLRFLIDGALFYKSCDILKFILDHHKVPLCFLHYKANILSVKEDVDINYDKKSFFKEFCAEVNYRKKNSIDVLNHYLKDNPYNIEHDHDIYESHLNVLDEYCSLREINNSILEYLFVDNKIDLDSVNLLNDDNNPKVSTL